MILRKSMVAISKVTSLSSMAVYYTNPNETRARIHGSHIRSIWLSPHHTQYMMKRTGCSQVQACPFRGSWSSTLKRVPNLTSVWYMNGRPDTFGIGPFVLIRTWCMRDVCDVRWRSFVQVTWPELSARAKLYNRVYQFNWSYRHMYVIHTVKYFI